MAQDEREHEPFLAIGFNRAGEEIAVEVDQNYLNEHTKEVDWRKVGDNFKTGSPERIAPIVV